MNFMLSRFDCITHFSLLLYLEETNLIVIAN